MKSKIFLIMATVALAISGVLLLMSTLAGQAQAISLAPADITLVIWHTETITETRSTLEQIAADFHTLHPTITVLLVEMTNDELYRQYLLGASHGGGPSLVRGQNDWIEPFAFDGLIRPIDDDFDLNRFITQTISATLYDNRHWGVPDTYGSHLMLFYNKSLLPSAPVSTTQMISVAQSLTGGGQYGLVYNMDGSYWLLPWLTGYGGWVLDENGSPVTPTLDTPAMVNALQFLHDLRWVHSIVPTDTMVDYDTADAMFRSGQAAMIINGDWTFGRYHTLLGNNLGVARLPMITDTGNWPQATVGSKVYYFNANYSGPAQEASKLFVEYATSKEVQLLWAQSGTLPALLEAFNDPLIQADPLLQASAAQAAAGRPVPISPEMGCVWSAIYGPFTEVMTDTITPTLAAAEMQATAAECITLLGKNAGWNQTNADGFGITSNGQVPSLAVFDGYLYAGTQNYSTEPATAEIWRTSNGIGWEKVDDHPANGAVTMIEFDGYLYAASWGESADIWRSANGLDWTTIITDGFGDANNGFAHFEVFSNTLYVGTWNGETGTEIWCTTNGLDWVQYGFDGLNGNPNNGGAISSAEFNGDVYYGLANFVTGAQLWRSSNGITGTAVITDGLAPGNRVVSSLAAFNGYLYAGMWNLDHVQLWRSSNGTDWEQVGEGVIGGPDANMNNALEIYDDQLYFVIENVATGLEVWRTANGVDWEQVGFAGFGDRNNRNSYWDSGTVVFNNRLYIATTNLVTGGEVWRLTLPVNEVYLPLLRK